MPYVRSRATYEEFIAERGVDEALHRHDGAAGYVVGLVRVVRRGDEEIDQATYDAEAAAIRAHNAALPQPEPPPPPPDVVGFLREARDYLGRELAFALTNDYGAILHALAYQDWPTARFGFGVMLADAVLTQEQHDALLALLDAHFIPQETAVHR